MAEFVPIPGNAWRSIINDKQVRHALDELSVELGVSLEDIQEVINNIETDVEDLDLTHDLLDTPTHVDTETNPPLPGSLVVGRPGTAPGDMSKFWIDGESIDMLPTTKATGGVQYWIDGLPVMAIIGLGDGDTVWVRLNLGTQGYVLTSTGVAAEWAEPNAILSRPGASVYLASNTAIAKETQTTLTFDSSAVEFDSGPFFSSSNPTRLTVPTSQSGTYVVMGQAQWAALTAIGVLRVFLLKNGSAVCRGESGNTNGDASPTVTIHKMLSLNAADYIELAVYWTHSDALDRTIAQGADKTFLQLVRAA